MVFFFYIVCVFVCLFACNYSFFHLIAISSTLKTTQCDCSALEDALGSSAGITESNIMSYMSLVEQKTIELLAIRAYLESKVTCQLVAQLFLPHRSTKSHRFLFFPHYRMLIRTTIPKSSLDPFWDSIQNSLSRKLSSNLQKKSMLGFFLSLPTLTC